MLCGCSTSYGDLRQQWQSLLPRSNVEQGVQKQCSLPSLSRGACGKRCGHASRDDDSCPESLCSKRFQDTAAAGDNQSLRLEVSSWVDRGGFLSWRRFLAYRIRPPHLKRRRANASLTDPRLDHSAAGHADEGHIDQKLYLGPHRIPSPSLMNTPLRVRGYLFQPVRHSGENTVSNVGQPVTLADRDCTGGFTPRGGCAVNSRFAECLPMTRAALIRTHQHIY